MIRFVIKGRMGNELFIYAHARSFAKTHGLSGWNYCFNYIDKLRYFTIDNNSLYFNFLKKNWFKLRLLLSKNNQHQRYDDCWNEQKLILTEATNTTIEGYFQGEHYFKNIAAEIRQLFSIRKKYTLAFEKKFSAIFAQHTTVALHIRGTDYAQVNNDSLSGPDLRLPLSYYHKIVAEITEKNPSAKFFILSDDIEKVKAEFAYLENSYYSNEDEITDFQLLLNADICVIANSTFSWWAAWLNKKNHKKIYAPQYFLGFKVKKEFPVNMIPSGWVKVNVHE